MTYSRKDLRSARRIRVTKTGIPEQPWEVSFWHRTYDQPCVLQYSTWVRAMKRACIEAKLEYINAALGSRWERW